MAIVIGKGGTTDNSDYFAALPLVAWAPAS